MKKDYNITANKLQEWDEQGFFPASCCHCGKTTLYPKIYKDTIKLPYECPNCLETIRFMHSND